MSRLIFPIADVARRVASLRLLISPRVGEMSGRTEGGAKECGLSNHFKGAF